jgi:hypothetical protein
MHVPVKSVKPKQMYMIPSAEYKTVGIPVLPAV